MLLKSKAEAEARRSTPTTIILMRHDEGMLRFEAPYRLSLPVLCLLHIDNRYAAGCWLLPPQLKRYCYCVLGSLYCPCYLLLFALWVEGSEKSFCCATPLLRYSAAALSSSG